MGIPSIVIMDLTVRTKWVPKTWARQTYSTVKHDKGEGKEHRMNASTGDEAESDKLGIREFSNCYTLLQKEDRKSTFNIIYEIIQFMCGESRS